MSQSITLNVSMKEFIDSIKATISRHPAIQQTVVLEMAAMMRERGNNLPAEGTFTLINILDYPNSPQFNEKDVRDALTEGDAALARRARRIEPAPVSALASIRRLLGSRSAHLARPDEAVRLYSQPDGWSCGYRCLQTLVFALRRAGPEYETALASGGLAEPRAVAPVDAIQAAIERGWNRGFDPTARGQTRRDELRLRPHGLPFVGSREWIGCCEACVALRSAGVRADVRAFHGRRDGPHPRWAAQRLVAYLANYFKNVGSADVWGASCLPPALVCFASHVRCVVGVSRDQLVLLDPEWREPRLQCMAPADLARHLRARALRADAPEWETHWECLVVRPGIATRAPPKNLNDDA